MSIQWILSDRKLANSFTLVKISLRLDFEQSVINLERDWTNFLGQLIALHLGIAKCGITLAVKIVDLFAPLFLQRFVLRWRHCNE